MKKSLVVVSLAVVLGAAGGLGAFLTRPRWEVTYPTARWVLLVVSPDGRRITVGSQSGGCATFDHIDVDDEPHVVSLTVRNRVRIYRAGLLFGRDRRFLCTTELGLDRNTVTLGEPLSGRHLVGAGQCDRTEYSCQNLCRAFGAVCA